MNRNWKSIILVISSFLALSTSISAAPGDLDPTFGNGGKLTDWEGSDSAIGVAIQQDGKILVVGTGYFVRDFRVARYNPDGTLDTTFGGGTGRVTTDFDGTHDVALSVVIQPDGKIVVAGVSLSSGNLGRLALVRYNPDGSLDITFGGGSGKVFTEPPGWPGHTVDVALQPDGKILAVIGHVDFDDNYDIDGLLVRYNPDGSLDTSFGNGGSVLTAYNLASVTLQPADGKIIVHGFWSSPIARFKTDGSPDTGFGSGGTVTIPAAEFLDSIAIDSAGKIVTAGSTRTGSFALWRFNVDGSPDSSFDGDGLVTTPSLGIATSVVMQSNGKIVAAGWSYNGSGYDFGLARYNSNGSLDNTFGGGDGITTIDFNNADDFAHVLALDIRGRIVVVGESGHMFAIARLLGDPTPNSSCANPIDCPDFFVRQHYQDFLNREPDAPGLAFWTNEIESCGTDAQCREVKRVNVSAAFFLSIEFQNTGYLVERIYKAAYGDATDAPTGAAVPVVRRAELTADAALVGQNVVVNAQGWEQQLEANKRAYALAFVQRQRFTDIYGALDATQFVDRLNANAGGVLTDAERTGLISEAAAGTVAARASVLRKMAENAELDRREKNRAFVLMQYFGYLRRDPDSMPDTNFSGYNFWLTKLDEFHGDYVRAEMVKAFLDSTEYRRRFRQN